MTLTHLPRMRALVAGMALMGLALMGAMVAYAPAVADDFDGEGGGGGDFGGPAQVDAEEQDLEVTESALYAHPVSDALPPILTESVPPQVVCVVFPELCPQELRPVTEPIGEAIDTGQEEMEVSPVQPVPEGSVATAYFGGFDRYESAVKFELPSIPEGEEVIAFQVAFPAEDPTYEVSSPSFRDFVQATMVAIGDQDPGVIAERLPDILANAISEQDELSVDSDLMRMEACPLTQPFEPGGAPEAQHADEMPREEGPDGEPGGPAVDCMLGGTASFDADAERWVFDLAFAADAWASGELENHGILISPIGVQNVAYGDPDISMNGQITIGIEDATVAMETAEPPPPVEELEEPQALGAEPMAVEDDGAGFQDAPANGNDFDGGAADAPAVADEPTDGDIADEPIDDPQVADDQELQQAAPAGTEPHTPWWVWLLVPAFAGGAYLVGNALTASPLAAMSGAGVERPGAMSRLIESRTGGGTPA